MHVPRTLRAGGLAFLLALGCANLGGCGAGNAKATGSQVKVDEQEQKQLEQDTEQFYKNNPPQQAD